MIQQGKARRREPGGKGTNQNQLVLSWLSPVTSVSSDPWNGTPKSGVHEDLHSPWMVVYAGILWIQQDPRNN